MLLLSSFSLVSMSRMSSRAGISSSLSATLNASWQFLKHNEKVDIDLKQEMSDINRFDVVDNKYDVCTSDVHRDA